MSQKVTGDTSDGYHTFNELYHHRAVLFATLCKCYPHLAWKSMLHSDGTMYDGMFIVGINTPLGPATYHYDIDPYWKMFCVRELENAPEWDGHTPAEALNRLETLPGLALTRQELLSMKDTPVWVLPLESLDHAGGWCVFDGIDALTPGRAVPWWNINSYGKLWIAFRNKPGGVLK